MNRIIKGLGRGIVLAATLVFLAPTFVGAQILRVDGTIVEGRIVGDDGVSLRVLRDGAEIEIAYDELQPRTIYRLAAGRAKDGDAAAQWTAGEHALAAGLLAQARRHFEAAGKVEPGRAAAVAAKKSEIDRLVGAVEAERTRRLHRSAMARRLDAIKAELDEADSHTASALEDSKSLRRAVDHFAEATRHLQRVSAALGRLAKEHGDHGDLGARVGELSMVVTARLVRAHLLAAELYSTRGSYTEAMALVNKARAADPESAEPAAAAARIEAAAAASSARRQR